MIDGAPSSFGNNLLEKYLHDIQNNIAEEHYFSNVSAGGRSNWHKLKDPSITFNPMNNTRFENGISGGIIGTLSGASAE